MHGFEDDLAFLQALVPELENYLLSDVLYYPITGAKGRQLTGDTTQLTVGNLLLSMRRVQVVQSELPEPATTEALMGAIEKIRTHWRTNWKKKVEREIPNRMRLWKNYLNDWNISSAYRAGDFHYNVRLRVILELLMMETDELLIQEKNLLRTLDMRLKGKGTPGDFIWDDRLIEAFPKDRFWFLYLHF